MVADRPHPSWPSLTVALDDRHSPLRQAVDRLLLDKQALRDLQKTYRLGAGPQLVPSGGGNPGTIGTAFDLLLRFLIEKAPDMGLALRGAAQLKDPATEIAVEIIRSAGGTLHSGPKAPAAHAVGELAGRRDEEELRELARSCWALALFVECFRSRVAATLGPIAVLSATGSCSFTSCLALATDADVDELVELVQLAQARLLPKITILPQPWYLGPVFAGSRFAHADGDLVAGGLLLEVKTNLGGKAASGDRRAALESETLRQLIGYVLHDFDDNYKLQRVGIYDARYGYLQAWDLMALLNNLASNSQDLWIGVSRDQLLSCRFDG